MSDPVRKATAALKAGRRTEAAAILGKLLAREPRHLDALYLLGTIEAERGQLGRAVGLLRRAAEVEPNSPYVQNNLGNALMLAGALEQAAEHFRRALALRPDLVEAMTNLGVLLRRLGRAAEAIDVLAGALRLRPASAEARYNLAGAHAELERHAEAAAELELVLTLAPDHVPSLELLGKSLARIGRTEEAVRVLRRYLELAGAGGEASEARLQLAALTGGEAPPRYPLQPMQHTYERKAATWDADVERPGREFLGPRHVRGVVERLYAGTGGLRVADIGCGTGLCGPFLRPLAARLEGVDLSAPMLARAAEKGCYDQLACEDLAAFLAARPARYDLVVASGVLILFGDLRPVFAAVSVGLEAGGRFVLTAYRSNQGPIEIRHNLHYAHSLPYIEESASAAGLRLESAEEVTHEFDAGVAQPGWLVTLLK
jgi:predicted TPR repeat methyltransferase